MLAQVPEKGKNTFLITHKPNIIDALGKDWFDVKEGEALIFKPEDGKYRLVARVQMEDWPKLVAVKLGRAHAGGPRFSNQMLPFAPPDCRRSIRSHPE
jgi:hypothetical protein